MRVGKQRARGAATVAACAMVVTLSTGGSAWAAPAGDPATPLQGAAAATRSLPQGWSLSTGGELTWSSPTRIPVGGARLDVVLGDRALGVGVLAPDLHSVTVRVNPGLAADPSVDWAALAVLAAGRRLDAGGVLDPAARAGAAAVAGALPPAGTLVADDPGRPGPYRTVSGEYALNGVTVAGLPEKVELRAVVVSPRGTTGPRPLVLLLHGRHETCYRGDEATLDWPCPAGFKPIPSYRGYLATQQLLASQGYVTVSISANGINAQDWLLTDGGAEARSQLIRRHLTLWRSWSKSAAGHAAAPAVVRSAPLADLGRVLLVGHSRGGEGANRAALDSTTGATPAWAIKGLVLIAPTAFGQNPVPGVPVAVLLPYCDGDVSDLQGQAYVDAARDAGKDPVLRSAVMVFGADHNFFNSEWTPGDAVAPAFDDWGDDTDRVCGKGAASTRLTPAAQRQVGATYTAAAAAVFVAGDTGALPLLDGSKARAASAGTARVLTHALGGLQTALLVPTSTTAITTTGSAAARTCKTAEASQPELQCVPDANYGSTPHFLPLYYLDGEPSRRALEVAWTKPTGAARVDLTAPRSLTGSTSLALRVAVPSGSSKVTFGVRLTDKTGHRLTLPDVSLTGLPADRQAFSGKTWGQEVRLALGASAVRTSRLDLATVTRIELLPKSATGRLWVLDAWGRRAGLSTAAPLRLVRLDVGTASVTEGSNRRTVRLPVKVTGPAHGAGRVWVVVIDPTPGVAPVQKLLDVPAGASQLSVDIPVAGDRRDDPDVLLFQVALKAVRGVAVGDYAGGLTVLDDDPSPTLSVVEVATSVTEGQDLVWRLQLSGPSDVGVSVQLLVTAPGVGLPPEVDTLDVPADWLTDMRIEPTPRRALSETSLFLYADIEAGTDSLEVVVPTRGDQRVEGAEAIVLSIDSAYGAVLPEPLPQLVGTVHDPA